MPSRADRSVLFDEAAAFISEVWGHAGADSEMHVGDLAWATFKSQPSRLDAIRLWRDDLGQVQVLTMFDGLGVCDFVVRPGAPGLRAAARALDWAEAKRRSVIGTEPAELRVGRRLYSPALTELLEERGFRRLRAGVPAMSRTISVADRWTSSTPDGYAIRTLVSNDIESRVRAFNEAFPGETLTADAYRSLRASSVYEAQLDVIVTSASSEVASFATLWLDARNAVVQIEPTGCHPDHRRLGLTRAVILRALHSAAELGATEALVRHVSTNTAAHQLYTSCGFATASDRTGFAKTIACVTE